MVQQLFTSSGFQPESLKLGLDHLSVDLFESKLRVPLRANSHIPRTALLERMEAFDSPMVVTVFAAPGFGKTTFLTQWVESTGRPVAWVSLDEGDNDPLVLLTYLAVAFAQLGRIDLRVFEALRSPTPMIETRVLPRLIRSVDEIDMPLTLVLDDIQVIHDQASLDALSTLILRLPPQVQIAISGRTEPSLPLPRLRSQGLVVDIGARDLSFGVDEAGALLQESDIHLRKPELVDLVDRTEGWPVGIYLAALSMRMGRAPHAVGSISGDDPYVADYLRTEFLDQLSDDTNDFLLRTAAVRDMCGALCDAILGTDNAASKLAALSRENMLVIPQDRQDKWYRYHHLFRELLIAELERRQPLELQEARSRASYWFEENGDQDSALAYAQEAGDLEHAGRVFASAAFAAYRDGRLGTVRRRLQWFLDRNLAETQPLVSLSGAWILTLTGEAEDAWRLARFSEGGLSGQLLADGITPASAWSAQLTATWCRSGIETMRADAEEALASTPEASSLSSQPLVLMGVATMLSGEEDLAEEYFTDAVEVAERTGSPHAFVIAGAEKAIAATEAGDWTTAWRQLRKARGTILSKGLEEYPLSAIHFATSAHVLAHRGDSSAAAEDLVSTQKLRPQLTYALPWLSVQVSLQSARAYMKLADPAGARTVLREAEAIFRRRKDLGILRVQLDELVQLVRQAPTTAPGMSSITSAELRLLPLLGTHLTFPEIGDRLYVSRHTVKSQAISIYRKLGVTSRSEAVLRASELGLLE